MRISIPNALVMVLLIASPRVALAYIGPGAGMTAIGTALALIGAVFLAIVGFVWYPIKRLRAKLRGRSGRKQDGEANPPS
jgi:hypothetical protein